MVKKDLKRVVIWELLSLLQGTQLKSKSLQSQQSPDKNPLSGVTSRPPTTSISCSECRMFFSTWSALVCMREMSMAKSLAWVLRENTDRHQCNFNILQSRRAVLCTHIVLLCSRHRQLTLGLDCLGFCFFFSFSHRVSFRTKPLLSRWQGDRPNDSADN